MRFHILVTGSNEGIIFLVPVACRLAQIVEGFQVMTTPGRTLEKV